MNIMGDVFLEEGGRVKAIILIFVGGIRGENKGELEHFSSMG